MDYTWLNYHHLLYFWTVVREGSVSGASRRLRLSQPTVSGQLKALEGSLELKLFHRVHGRLVLTDAGAHIYRYADEIFTLGRQLQDSLRGRALARLPRLVVGVSDVVPKLIAHRLLAPALERGEPSRLVVYEDRDERLMAQLAVHALDLVLCDSPAESSSPVRAFSHLLGECGVTLFARRKMAEKLRRNFPKSLDQAPWLLPTENTALRRSLERWFEAKDIRPVLRGEFEDSALMDVFGQKGVGVFPGPSAIADEICRHFGVARVGEVEEIRERFYAVSVERQLQHPAAVAILEGARRELFPAGRRPRL